MSSPTRPKPDLLGRSRELAKIDAAIAGARKGRGATICLLGETGMGKSSLLAAAAERARGAGFEVVGTEEQAVRGLLARAARGPTAFLVDDAELLDPESLEVVRTLARRMLAASALLVLAARPTSGDRSERLDELIASVPPERTIELRPLSPEHSATLVATLVGVELGGEEAEACGRLTGGVPLQARLLADELAHTHRTSARVGMADLEAAASISARRFLQRGTIDRASVRLLAASVLTPGSTTPDAAARVARVDPDAASRLARTLAAYGLVRNPDTLEPADPVVGQAAIESLAEEERHDLRARIVADLHAQRAGVEAIAPHLLELKPSGDPRVVATLLKAAADPGSTAERAIEYSRRALAEPPTAAERPRVLLTLGVALGRAGNDDAVTTLRDAVEQSDGNPDLRTDAVRELALRLARDGHGLEAAALLEERIDQIADGPREAVLALELEHAGLAPLSPALHDRVRDRLKADRWRLKSDTPLERSLLSAGTEYEAMAAGDAETAASLVLKAFRIRPLSGRGGKGLDGGRAIWLLLRAERFYEAMQLIERLLHEAGGSATAAAAMFHAQAAYLQIQLGDMDAAGREAAEGLGLAQANGFRMPAEMAAAYQATALLEQDRLEAAIEAIEASPLSWEGPTPSPQQPGTFGSAQLLIARGRLRIAVGQEEEGLKDLLEVAAQKRRIGVANPAGFPWLGPAVEVLVSRGERERAEALAVEPLAAARRWGAPGALALTLAAAGRARRRLAEIEEAAAIVRGAATRSAQAEVACLLAVAKASGKGSAGEVVSAANLAEACGMHRLARLTRARLSSRTDSQPNGLVDLTDRELEVVEMIAEGMTNAQIGAGLSISPRTVQVHVANAMRKSGTGNRTELAALALRRHPSR